jgi:transposase-like protein
MPWKVPPVSEHRLALCHAVRTAGRSVSDAAADFDVSRKTAYKWLACFDAAQSSPLLAMVDRSRRPRHSPRQTGTQVEQSILQVRDQLHWGPRKIHAFLRQEAVRQGQPPPTLPSVRTLSNILRRSGRRCRPFRCSGLNAISPTSCGRWTSRGRWRLTAASSCR